MIEQGLVPGTSKAFGFDKYMIGDFTDVGIPSNAPHKAAALVLANLILDPEFQDAHILPENGFGLGYGIHVNRVTDVAARQSCKMRPQNWAMHDAPADLARSMGDSAAKYQKMAEEGWGRTCW